MRKEIMKKNLIICVSLIFLGIVFIPQQIYRFKHPEMTETQLFLNFFKAYLTGEKWRNQHD
jgi:hypothetical protein